MAEEENVCSRKTDVRRFRMLQRRAKIISNQPEATHATLISASSPESNEENALCSKVRAYSFFVFGFWREIWTTKNLIFTSEWRISINTMRQKVDQLCFFVLEILEKMWNKYFNNFNICENEFEIRPFIIILYALLCLLDHTGVLFANPLRWLPLRDYWSHDQKQFIFQKEEKHSDASSACSEAGIVVSVPEIDDISGVLPRMLIADFYTNSKQNDPHNSAPLILLTAMQRLHAAARNRWTLENKQQKMKMHNL